MEDGLTLHPDAVFAANGVYDASADDSANLQPLALACESHLIDPVDEYMEQLHSALSPISSSDNSISGCSWSSGCLTMDLGMDSDDSDGDVLMHSLGRGQPTMAFAGYVPAPVAPEPQTLMTRLPSATRNWAGHGYPFDDDDDDEPITVEADHFRRDVMKIPVVPLSFEATLFSL